MNEIVLQSTSHHHEVKTDQEGSRKLPNHGTLLPIYLHTLVNLGMKQRVTKDQNTKITFCWILDYVYSTQKPVREHPSPLYLTQKKKYHVNRYDKGIARCKNKVVIFHHQVRMVRALTFQVVTREMVRYGMVHIYINVDLLDFYYFLLLPNVKRGE